MSGFVYPSVAELQEIDQVFAAELEGNDPVFQYMPTVDSDEYWLIWEQQDSFFGLQQLRGLDGKPTRVKKVGARAYSMEPGVYGEYIDLNERELTTRRKYGTFGQTVNIDDLVTRAKQQLVDRRYKRLRKIAWDLFTTGTFSVAAPNGQTIHTDTFPIQTFTSSPLWSTPTTSAPFADLRAVRALGPPVGASFNGKATAFMNQITYNYLSTNTNSADLGGRRVAGLQPVNTLKGINELLTGDDLPNIVIYDEGYLGYGSGEENPSTSGIPSGLANYGYPGGFTKFLANGKVVVFGAQNNGANIAEYRYVRNLNNSDMAPGPYSRVIDHGENTVPRTIDVHDGHNGGPVIFFPGSVIVMTVA